MDKRFLVGGAIAGIVLVILILKRSQARTTIVQKPGASPYTLTELAKEAQQPAMHQISDVSRQSSELQADILGMAKAYQAMQEKAQQNMLDMQKGVVEHIAAPSTVLDQLTKNIAAAQGSGIKAIEQLTTQTAKGLPFSILNALNTIYKSAGEGSQDVAIGPAPTVGPAPVNRQSPPRTRPSAPASGTSTSQYYAGSYFREHIKDLVPTIDWTGTGVLKNKRTGEIVGKIEQGVIFDLQGNVIGGGKFQTSGEGGMFNILERPQTVKSVLKPTSGSWAGGGYSYAVDGKGYRFERPTGKIYSDGAEVGHVQIGTGYIYDASGKQIGILSKTTGTAYIF